MNTYDQLALSTLPTFYLSAPEISDKSMSGFYTFVNNDVAPEGQSLIVGHSNSFKITKDKTLDVVGDLGFFRKNCMIEMVVKFEQPTYEFPILYDVDNQSGLFITPGGLFLRLRFENDDDVVVEEEGKFIQKWGEKYYVRLVFSEDKAALVINDEEFEITYDYTPLSVTDMSVGLSTAEDHSFLLDGFGCYESKAEDKKSFIDDSNNGYRDVSSKLFGGMTTLFNTYKKQFSEKITQADFQYEDLESRLYVFTVPPSDDPCDYFIVRNSNELLSFAYKLDGSDDWTLFSKDFVILNDPATETIALAWQFGDSEKEQEYFEITIIGVREKDIYEDSPAVLILSGLSLYPDEPGQSIVNNPHGVRMFESYYSGAWQNTVSETSDYRTVEMVFKAHDLSTKTYVFYSTDGSASYGPGGSIAGFTAYLNGSLVTDLSDISEDQWYHLVMINDADIDLEFNLNYSNELTAGNISYLLLTVYENELTQQNAELLFSVLVGSDAISYEETNSIISEATDPYKAYSYTWSIIGAGGH